MTTATRSWFPKVTGNGWYPKLRPNGQHVVYGFWQTHIADLTTGVETELLAPTGSRVQSLGWLDNDNLLVGTETGPAAIYKIPLAIIPAGGKFTFPVSCDLKVPNMPAGFSWGNARGGHWGIGLAGLPYSMKDGLPFRQDRSQYGIYVAGDHLLTADLSRNYEIQHFVGNALLREYPSDNQWLVNEQGDVLSGYYGTVRCYPFDWQPTPGEPWVDATIAPWKTEGIGAVPVRLNGELWIWTFTSFDIGGGLEETWAMGRRLGETDPIIAKKFVGATACADVIVVGNEFVLAANSPKGLMEVRWVPIDSPREKLVPLVPVVAPLPRPIWTGYYFSMSDRYGDNPTAPGTCQMVLEKDAILRAVTLGMKMIVPAEFIDLVPNNQLVAVTCGGATVSELEVSITAARTRMAELNCLRPLAGYLDMHDWDRMPSPAPDWFCPMVYCKVTENPDQFKSRVKTVMAKFPAAAKIYLTCQAYTTNKTLTEDLLPIQYVYPELAREDPRVVGLVWFSDGREGRMDGKPVTPTLPADIGGTRFNAFIRPAHIATVAAAGAPTIVDVNASPEVTIASYSFAAIEGAGARAVAKITGAAQRLQWLARVHGPNNQRPWSVVADNPASDLDHTYQCAPGQWEIAARVQPGGAQTQSLRIVTVTPKPLPPPEGTPVTDAEITQVIAGCYFDMTSAAIGATGSIAERRPLVHAWVLARIGWVSKAYIDIFTLPGAPPRRCDLEGYGSRVLLMISKPSMTELDLRKLLQDAFNRGDR